MYQSLSVQFQNTFRNEILATLPLVWQAAKKDCQDINQCYSEEMTKLGLLQSG